MTYIVIVFNFMLKVQAIKNLYDCNQPHKEVWDTCSRSQITLTFVSEINEVMYSISQKATLPLKKRFQVQQPAADYNGCLTHFFI